jgi:hypothetical protein
MVNKLIAAKEGHIAPLQYIKVDTEFITQMVKLTTLRHYLKIPTPYDCVETFHVILETFCPEVPLLPIEVQLDVCTRM